MENTTTCMSCTDPGKLDMSLILDAQALLHADTGERPSVMKFGHKDSVEMLQKALAKTGDFIEVEPPHVKLAPGAITSVFGMKMIIDKSVPEDEFWIETNKKRITHRFKIK